MVRRWSVLLWLRGVLTLLLLTVLFVETSRVSGYQFGGGPGGSSRHSGSSFIPTFQDAPCPFTLGAGIIEGKQVRCGYVTVPQNRAINAGATVKLAVAIFKSQQYMNSIDPAPVLRLEGGPGISDLNGGMSAITAANYKTFVFHHDLVFFDQRGTGYSTPSLDCFGQPARACYDRLISSGIDLSNFTTLENAADVADLIHALGYQKMTLYGVSYGTRLALTVMRLHPQVVRAVVLDSVYPPDFNRDRQASSAQRAFTTLFQGCAADPDCNAKYPNLRNVFFNVFNQLNAHPISFTLTIPGTGQQYPITSLTGDQWVKLLYNALYYTPLIPRLPKAISLVPQLIAQLKEHIHTWIVNPYPHPSVAFEAGSISLGAYYSIECSEDWPFLTQEDITHSLQGVTLPIARAVGDIEQAEYDVCQFWKVPTVSLARNQPLISTVPALILAGQYDPITPPSNGQEVAKELSHSFFFLFPGVGHEVQYNSTCADQIISAFEDDPSQQPDSACLARMKGPAFL